MKCKHCGQTYKQSLSTSNMYRHIRKEHGLYEASSQAAGQDEHVINKPKKTKEIKK